VNIAVSSRTSSRYKALSVSLSVTDVNDHPPRFSPPAVVVNVSETAALGKTIALPGASDDDAGENARLSFEVHWNGSTAAGKLELRVSEAAGGGGAVLGLVVVGRLDREAEATYAATVTAVDAGTPARSGRLDVTVRVADANDNAPRFESERYEATMSEDAAPGATVAQVRAVDADTGDNGAVRYRLERRTAARHGAAFAVDEATGAVTLRRRLDARPPDGTYRLMIAAEDRGPDAVVVYTDLVVNVVDVNNHAPSILVSGDRQLHVMENQPADTKVRTVYFLSQRSSSFLVSDHYFRSVCLSVCLSVSLSVCLFVQSFSQPSSIRFGSN